jgi:hypothetical protein
MYQLSESRYKALQRAQNFWKRGDTHPSMQEWRKEAIEAFGFYDGSGQWRSQDLAVLRSRDQFAMTINLIQGKIDSLSGAEIQSRIRSACKNQSGDPNLDFLAMSLSHFLFFVQEHERMPAKDSIKFRDMLVCGIGWSNIYQEGGKIYYENIHPYNMIPDMDDLSPDFSDMKFVGRKRWLSPDMVKLTWPKASSYINFNAESFLENQAVYSPEIMDRSSISTDYNDYPNADNTRILVCEIQSKEPKKAYSGLDKNGFYFETFDEEKAEELANSPSDMEEIDSNRIISTMFIGDCLLQTGPLDPDLPSRKDCNYTPCVWKRRFNDGVPYGLLDSMKDVQRDVNVRQTKGIYQLNSSRMIITGELNPGQDPTQISQQLKASDSVIILPGDTKYDLHNNADLSEGQLKMYDKYDIMLQRITGIFDDFQGKQTNTTSGVALKQRQMASIRNNVFAFDNFSEMKQREAKIILSMIQGGGYENLLSQIVGEEESQAIILNMTREVNGKKYVFNDVRTLPVSLYIEEIPDFSSSTEEDKFILQEIMANPMAHIILTSPDLLKMFGVRDYQKISKHFQQLMGAQNGQMSAPSQLPAGEGMPQEQGNLAYPRVA